MESVSSRDGTCFYFEPEDAILKMCGFNVTHKQRFSGRFLSLFSAHYGLLFSIDTSAFCNVQEVMQIFIPKQSRTPSKLAQNWKSAYLNPGIGKLK